MNEKELEEQLIFKTVAGSHCYGMNTATSDEDIRGIVVLKDPKYYIGFGLHNFEQKDSWEDGNDRVYYDVRKAIKLMAENNPNMLELMFIDERFWRHTTPQWQLLVDNRELFISARVGYSYGGYAISQIKKIERHRKWLIDPPKKRPEKKDYGLDDFVSHEQLGAFNKLLADLIKNQLLILNLSASTMEEITKLDFDAYAKTITEPSEENIETVSIALHFTKELTERLLREKKFQSDLKHYESYLSWRDNRNEKRRDLEAKFGYDCYSYDTEFLTDSGWKLFDEIESENKLATVFLNSNNLKTKKTFGIEYQNYTEKFDSKFTGNMYQFSGFHTDCFVTPNHRMLVQKTSKEITKSDNSWELSEAANLPDTFNFLVKINPNTKNYTNENIFDFKQFQIPPIVLMRIIGMFLSDGTIEFRNEKVKSIRITQKSGGKLHKSMKKIHNKYGNLIQSNIYKYKRSKNKFRNKEITEIILTINEDKIRNFINNECGHSNKKRIPNWIFFLSKRMMEALFDSMVMGDGTIRKVSYENIIYYTNSYELASDVMRLAFLCGWQTNINGPYDYKNNKYKPMYQVYINKNCNQTKKIIRSKNIEKINVQDHRIVCFTVPNGTLVTRRNGYVSIHGNCKFASQAMRLLINGEEILEGKGLIVFRPDAEELLAIKNGKYKFDELMEIVKEKEAKLLNLAKTTKIQKTPNLNKIDDLCQQIIQTLVFK